MFSHDELVCQMATLSPGSLSSRQMQLVYKDLLTMVDEEKKARKRLFDKVQFLHHLSVMNLRRSCGSVVKAMDLLRASLGSAPTDTHVSH